MNAIRAIASLLALILIGCSNQSKSDKLVKELEAISSWTATAQMVGETWTQGTVPQTYAKQTLAKTRQELAKEAQMLSQPELARQQPQLPKRIRQLEQIVQQMTIAIEQNNKPAIARQIQQLNATQQQLDELAKVQGERP
jgi:hypothetical protein